MRIEGLGRENPWDFADITHRFGRNQLTPENIKVGKEISNNVGRNETGNWIITDILGDGKFKAVPKSELDKLGNSFGNDPIRKIDYLKKQFGEPRFGTMVETFDISGKVDTNNPIYQFYEKEVSKYLKRIEPNVQRVIDPQGVTWNQIDIRPEHKISPVTAFGMVGAALGIGALQGSFVPDYDEKGNFKSMVFQPM